MQSSMIHAAVIMAGMNSVPILSFTVLCSAANDTGTHNSRTHQNKVVFSSAEKHVRRVKLYVLKKESCDKSNLGREKR